jgi:hypothetical protein
MKYLIIFLVILFFISAIWYAPQNVHVGTGLAERLMTRIESFSEVANTARTHMDYLEVIKRELEFIKTDVHSVPSSFNQSGINGLITLTRVIASIVIDITALPLFLLTYVIAFIIDSIVIIFKFFDFFTLFT